MNKRVLVVEDEATIREFIVINLKRRGYETVEAHDGETALEIFALDRDFQIVLLDIMMPGIDGIKVCREIRKMDANVGIIMLTARTQDVDKIRGFNQGADDYITKPFSPPELMVRVDSLYRRVELTAKNAQKQNEAPETLTSGDIVLHLRRRRLTMNGVEMELTQIEYQLLEFFFSNPDKEFTRDELLERVWGANYVGQDKIVDVNIRRLRMKIEKDPSRPMHIITVWGHGYKWRT